MCLKEKLNRDLFLKACCSALNWVVYISDISSDELPFRLCSLSGYIAFALEKCSASQGFSLKYPINQETNFLHLYLGENFTLGADPLSCSLDSTTYCSCTAPEPCFQTETAPLAGLALKFSLPRSNSLWVITLVQDEFSSPASHFTVHFHFHIQSTATCDFSASLT